jgi:GntR family transcriptional regulator
MSTATVQQIFKKHWRPQQSASKYAQVVQIVQSAIAANDLAPGSRIPTEQNFVEGMPFSLGTIQRAMRILVNRGIVERRKGVGTFVTKGANRLNAPLQCRFFNEDGEGFLEIFSQVISRRVTNHTGPWTRYLGDDAKRVLQIDRMLKTPDDVRVLSRFYLDSDRMGALKETPVDQLHGTNFRELLDREFGLAIVGFAHNLRVEAFDKKVSKLLKVSDRSVGAVLEAVAFAEGDIPIYFQELYYPENPYTLSVSGYHHLTID